MFGLSFDNIMGLFNSIYSIYSGYKSYESQQDATKLQSEAAEQQVRTAGLQEAQAAQQEIAGVEQERINEANIIKQAEQFALEEGQKRKADAQLEGDLKARAAASGAIATSGSIGLQLEQQGDELEAERDWLAKANQSTIDVMGRNKEYDSHTAQMAADATRIQASNTMAQAAGTKAGAEQTKANSYGSLMGSANRVWDIGNRTNWYGLA